MCLCLCLKNFRCLCLRLKLFERALPQPCSKRIMKICAFSGAYKNLFHDRSPNFLINIKILSCKTVFSHKAFLFLMLFNRAEKASGVKLHKPKVMKSLSNHENLFPCQFQHLHKIFKPQILELYGIA